MPASIWSPVRAVFAVTCASISGRGTWQIAVAGGSSGLGKPACLENRTDAARDEAVPPLSRRFGSLVERGSCCFRYQRYCRSFCIPSACVFSPSQFSFLSRVYSQGRERRSRCHQGQSWPLPCQRLLGLQSPGRTVKSRPLRAAEKLRCSWSGR